MKRSVRDPPAARIAVSSTVKRGAGSTDSLVRLTNIRLQTLGRILRVSVSLSWTDEQESQFFHLFEPAGLSGYTASPGPRPRPCENSSELQIVPAQRPCHPASGGARPRRQTQVHHLTTHPRDSARRWRRAAARACRSSSCSHRDARAVPAPCECRIRPRAGASRTSGGTYGRSPAW